MATVKDEGKQYEAQYIYKNGVTTLTSGIGRVDSEKLEQQTLTFIGLPFPIEISATTPLDQKSAYLYLNSGWSWGESIVGLDYANLDDSGALSETKINPKLGLI